MSTSTTQVLKKPSNSGELDRFVIYTMLAIALYLTAITIAYAAMSPMGTVMCRVLYIIYGNLGRASCTLAIVIVGIGATLGKVSWGLAVTVATGVAAIFGSAAVASYLLLGTPASLTLNSTVWAAGGCL